MKALTLWQPWASLIALGVKTVETRSWATTYRGPVLIHAAAKGLPVGGVRCPPNLKRDGTWAEQDAVNHQSWLALNTITDPAYQGPQPCNPATGRQRRIPRRAQTPTLFWPHAGPHYEPGPGEYPRTEYLPLAAVVAVAELIDVVPMVPSCDWPTGTVQHLVVTDDDLQLHAGYVQQSIELQRPYGDFQPGRWAWLLEDVRPLPEPVPCPGRQGLWEPNDALLALLP